jgi:hypothetical protein
MLHLRLSSLALATVLLAAPLGAQQTFFGEDTDGSETTRSTLVNSLTAQNLFLAMLQGVGTEDFNSFSPGFYSSLGLNFPGAGSATLLGGGNVVALPGTGTDGFGRYPISSPNFWEVNANSFSIAFSNPVAAFGFFGVDIGDFGGILSLSFLTGSGSIVVPVPHTVASSGSYGGSSGGSVFFFGYINTASPFTKVTFNIAGDPTDFFGFDNMTIGSVEQVVSVPEPSGILLLATGLLGVVAIRSRRGPGLMGK